MACRFGRCRTILFAMAVLLVSLGPIGCGSADGPNRVRVSGKVTFQGKPVPVGAIYFDPDTSKGNEGPQGFAPIKDGQYDTSRDGTGVVGGPHRVRIAGFDGVASSDDAPQGRPLFPPYTTTVDLPKESVQKDFDIPASP